MYSIIQILLVDQMMKCLSRKTSRHLSKTCLPYLNHNIKRITCCFARIMIGVLIGRFGCLKVLVLDVVDVEWMKAIY